ncbi:MAG TPA: class I SAM-dependent methyltransferase [Candidatus Limnocylindria bacterium]|jgi:SAM-dependent methyltransferase|nr:class I SAM-dependent methyltransferase [Candidatus Limnocylindria bacterium]
MSQRSIDLDALMAQVRERIREKREKGIYGPDVEALLRVPLPGGRRIFSDDLEDPLASLAEALDEEVEYDPRSRKPIVGPLITFARRAIISLTRWWMGAILERQERINRLLAAAYDYEGQMAPRFGARLESLERWREHQSAANLHSEHFQARFGGEERVIRKQSEAFVDLFKGRERVLDLGSGRGIFLQLLKDKGIGGYGVDLDPRMVAHCRAKGFEVHEAEALTHLRQVEAGSVDGLYARHLAEHILPGELVEILRACRRALAPGAPLVFVTPNPRTLTVGAHTFWLDPQHLRPIPPELFKFYLEVEGFIDVDVRTFEPSEKRLREDVPEGAIRENVKLLNETLFGDRDYAVIGRAPSG